LQAFNTERELGECFLKLRKYPNVVGIDGELQLRIKNHKAQKGTEVIRVYVSEKFPESSFFDRSFFSRIRTQKQHWRHKDLLPKMINGIEVDVVEVGDVQALCASARMKQEMDGSRPIKPRQVTQTRFRPLQSGTSCTHYQSTACTLNGLFREKDTGKLLMASNNHCFGRENTAKIGDPILQPSPYDGGTFPKDQVGEFYKCVEIRFGNFKSSIRNSFHRIFRIFRSQDAFFNRVDIAFASFKCPNCPKCEPMNTTCIAKVLGIGLPIGKILPDLNQRVQKMGRTTGKTIGTIVSTSWTGTVKYSRGSATFIDCILVSGKNFSLGGDSGSPVLDMNCNYIGALFAGSGDHAIVCKYINIEKEANVELVILPPLIEVTKTKKRRVT
jgi:hypothetical protein